MNYSDECDFYLDSMKIELLELTLSLMNKYNLTVQQAETVCADVWFFRTKRNYCEIGELNLVRDSVKGIRHNINEYA